MTLRALSLGRLMLPVGLSLVLFAATKYTGNAEAQTPRPQPPAGGTCPGQAMPVQATGEYKPTTVPDITVNGQPGPGAIWGAGMRSYWHCHAGGQIMMLDEGEGRVQKRGQRVRTLRRGETEYAAPGEEHWHGAAPNATALYFQTSIGNTTALWMEEVGRDDYLGNDIGIKSREEFLKSGVRKKPESETSAVAPAAATPAR